MNGFYEGIVAGIIVCLLSSAVLILIVASMTVFNWLFL